MRELSSASRREKHQQRRVGWTGSFDTPAETWTAMREASLAGEASSRSLSERFRVLYSAVFSVGRRTARMGVLGIPTRRGPSAPSNVIHFPRRVIDGGRASEAQE